MSIKKEVTFSLRFLGHKLCIFILFMKKNISGYDTWSELPCDLFVKYIHACYYCQNAISRLVIRTSRTVGSAKKFVRITSGFGGGEFTKTLRKECTCQRLKFSFLLLEYCKIRECYAVANAFTIRNMYCLLSYMKCSSRKINCPTKNMTKIVTLLLF